MLNRDKVRIEIDLIRENDQVTVEDVREAILEVNKMLAAVDINEGVKFLVLAQAMAQFVTRLHISFVEDPNADI